MITTYTSWRGRRWRGEIPSEAVPEVSSADAGHDLDLVRALSGLSPRQRAVVVLRYYEDLTEADTATALDCSVGTVKAHHSRAIAHLRTSGLLSTDDTEEAR